jgi:putative ATPase
MYKLYLLFTNIWAFFLFFSQFSVTLQSNMSQPLAERLRPRTLDDYIGQQHLVGEGAVLRKMIDAGRISSFILWGPPGVGKTTLAQIIAHKLETPFFTLSAVTSGVKDVRDVIEKAQKGRFFNEASPILFIDEIHRFSKSQQDSLLGAVERGVVTLIGATTENPSFEVIRPLLSRCQLYVLKSLEKDDLLQLLDRAIHTDVILKEKHIDLKETGAILRYSGGDARKLLNILELVVESESSEDSGAAIVITDELVNIRLQQNPLAYDKDGEMHYDIISAFIKSIRGSDPDAALYWLARMIEGGEDPVFIARRLVISAAEDIGLANPNALLLANAAFDAVNKIGWPEGRIPLAEATVYLATSPKSNSAYLGIDAALDLVRRTGNQPVPLPIRNAPTQLMKELGYHDGYKYPHDYPGHFTPQQYLPDELVNERIWHGQLSPSEAKLVERMKNYWGERYER